MGFVVDVSHFDFYNVIEILSQSTGGELEGWSDRIRSFSRGPDPESLADKVEREKQCMRCSIKADYRCSISCDFCSFQIAAVNLEVANFSVTWGRTKYHPILCPDHWHS